MGNKTNRLVHIFGQTPHHYLPMQSFLQKCCRGSSIEQTFWAWQTSDKSISGDIEFYEHGKDLIRNMKLEPEGTRFIFHGMFDRSIWPALCFSSLLKKSVWVCWGAEVYQHLAPKRRFKLRVAYYFHKMLIRQFIQTYSLNDGDGALIEKVLGKVGVKTLPYPLIGSEQKPTDKPHNAPFRILLGNSASVNNEHEEALEWLARFSAENIRIIVPLNYAGPTEYIERVVETGERLFGNKFEPITNMLDKNQYDALLANVDTAVFAHHRQQGLYVVYSMLKYGRRMFLRSTVSSYADLTASGFDIAKSDNIQSMSFAEFTKHNPVKAERNAQLMSDTFSEAALIPKWTTAMNALFK